MCVTSMGVARGCASRIMSHSLHTPQLLLPQRDTERDPIHKIRHCFLWRGSYFQLDEYTDKCPSRLEGSRVADRVIHAHIGERQ